MPDSIETIEKEFIEKSPTTIALAIAGHGRFRILTPHTFEDGDHPRIVLKKEKGNWKYTDDGNTNMRIGKDGREPPASKPPFHIEDRNGELILPIPEKLYTESLIYFTNTLLEIDRKANRPQC